MNDNCISESNDDADDSFNIVSINSDHNVLGDGECVDEKILLLNNYLKIASTFRLSLSNKSIGLNTLLLLVSTIKPFIIISSNKK